jgi:ferric-dicitrate binding protein FerR (iron transport regulator)
MRNNKFVTAGIALLLILSVTGLALAQTTGIAVVTVAKGKAEMRAKDADDWAAVKMGRVLNDGDALRTGGDGFIALIFTDDKSQIKIRPNTDIVVSAEREQDNSLSKRVNMEIGELFADVQQQKGEMQIATPTSVASIKGTSFWVLVDENGGTTVLTLEGLIELLNNISGETTNVGQGQFGQSNPDGSMNSGSGTGGQGTPQFSPDGTGGEGNNIELQFQDADGNIRTMQIQYGTD